MTDASELLVPCFDTKAWADKPERYRRNAPKEVQDFLLPAIAQHSDGSRFREMSQAFVHPEFDDSWLLRLIFGHACVETLIDLHLAERPPVASAPIPARLLLPSYYHLDSLGSRVSRRDCLDTYRSPLDPWLPLTEATHGYKNA